MANMGIGNKVIIGGYIIAAIAFTAIIFTAMVSNEGFLDSLLLNGDWINNYYNLDYSINNGYNPYALGFSFKRSLVRHQHTHQ